MLKKFFISIIAVFYLSAVSGVAVNFHYCMGKIASISLFHEKDHDDGNCSKCGMDQTINHCCKDDLMVLKVNDTHQPSAFSFVLNDITQDQPVHLVDLTHSEQGLSILPLLTYFSPPPASLNKVYQDVRIFRI